MPSTNRPELPTLWVDVTHVLVRDDPNVAVMRFYTLLPDAQVEACRVIMPVSQLKQLIEKTCRTLAFYPTQSDDGIARGKR